MSNERVSTKRIMNAVERSGGNLQEAARRLGMRRNSLYERVETAALTHDLAAVRERYHTVRIRAAAWEAARQAAYDLAYAERRDVTPQDVVLAFFDETFEPWLEAKIAAAGKP